MSARVLAAAAAMLLAIAASACEREGRWFGGAPAAGVTPRYPQGPYEGNAYGISQGKELFQQFNCVGCHSHGGGGMAPPLMDAAWRYGSNGSDIAKSIVEGRPNGMPAFGQKIPPDQVWQLVAYVRSLPGLVRSDVASGRAEHMRVKESEQERYDQPPPRAESPPTTARPSP